MSREIGPERTHFGGENGLVQETVRGVTKCYWRCSYCSFQMGGRCFQNMKTRIHLSGDVSLRNWCVGTVCPTAPDDVKKQFALLVQEKRLHNNINRAKRKWQQELMHATPPKKSGCTQSKLRISPHSLQDEVVDNTWGSAFFGLDIAVNKICNPAFPWGRYSYTT